MTTWNTRARFSRSERNGTLVILAVLLALTAFKRPLAKWLAAEPVPVRRSDHLPLIEQIEQAKQQSRSMSYAGNPGKSFTDYPEKGSTSYRLNKLEINSATVAEWESLYGIGPVLAARIVKFRDGIGGFQRIEQVREVYGIKPEVFEQIRSSLRVKPAPVRQLNINEADLETLMAHPYIPPTLAKQFVGYRTRVKPFDQVEDIKNLYYLRDHPELYEKLYPYLTVN